MLDAVRDLMDLKAPPSNHLEKLKGHLAGLWSIRVNEQYRLIFRFANGNADQVRIVDYHQARDPDPAGKLDHQRQAWRDSRDGCSALSFLRDYG